MGYIHVYLAVVGFILIAHAPKLVENSIVHSLRLPSSNDMAALVSRFTCRDEPSKTSINQAPSEILVVACGASAIEAPKESGVDNVLPQISQLKLRIPSGVENALTQLSQAVNDGVEAAKGWSKVLSDHWTTNKAAADKRWKERQDALLHGSTDKSSEQQQSDDDVDWRHKHVHADWRNLIPPEQQGNGSESTSSDWRHMNVHADWRNLRPPADASSSSSSAPAETDPAAAEEAAADAAAPSDAAAEEAEAASEEEEEEDAEAVAESLAERREELRRGVRHQHIKDVKSHRSGLTGNLHTHQH